MKTFARLLRLGNASPPRLALAALLGTLTTVFGVGLMATAGYLISRAAEQPAILSLTVAIVGVRFFGLARPVARYCERLASHDIAFRALTRVRTLVYDRIEPLAPAQLTEYQRGDLLSRMVADVDAVQNLTLRGVGPALVAVGAGAISVGVATAVLPAAGLVLAVGLVLTAVLVPLLTVTCGRHAARRQAAARGRLTAELIELVGGAPELVVYGREDERVGRMRALDDDLARTARRAALADGIGEAARLTLTGVTVAAVLATAVSAHADGRLGRVSIAVLALLALASFEAVQPLGTAARELAGTIAAGRRVLELTDAVPAVVDPERPAPLPAGPLGLELDAVAVAARLHDFSLRLAPGEKVALLGPSGAGKTTVTELLLRFLDPDGGRVTLGGLDVSSYRMDDVRSAIAVAGQDAHLFSATIRDNVTLGRPAGDEDVARALRAARLERWVSSLPEGLGTLVGEEGAQLSGGQRQRIVLARALLCPAPVLVLDEPTAHLDVETATELLNDVFAAANDRSVLLITHRPEGLELVDRVVRMPARAA
jgi:thiol reductant ABC exporter CydC subunit